MAAYHYQCSSCDCTLFADALPEGEEYTYVSGGTCASCQSQQNAQADYDDDD